MEKPYMEPDDRSLQDLLLYCLAELRKKEKENACLRVAYNDLQLLYDAQIDYTEMLVDELNSIKGIVNMSA